MEGYPYFASHGIDKSVCKQLFASNVTTSTDIFSLQGKPKKGVYVDLLKYYQMEHSHKTTTEFGRILMSIDPWLNDSVQNPKNAYLKALKLKRKRHQNFDDVMTYKKRKTLDQTSESFVSTDDELIIKVYQLPISLLVPSVTHTCY